MSKPVVNRSLKDASRSAAIKAGFKPKKETVKTRTREVVGGGGLQLVFEDPVKSMTPKARKNGSRQCGLDPLVLEENERTRRRLTKARAARICKILARHLDRFSEKDYVKDPKIPNLHIATGWLKGKTETQLLELLVHEIAGRCRAETTMRIHHQYSVARGRRERKELLKAFFHEDVANSSQIRQYIGNYEKGPK